MKRKYLALLLLIFTLSFLSFPEESSAADWKHVQRGTELMNQNKYNEAIIELNKAVSISPKASTYRRLAISYEKTAQYQKAADTYYLEEDVHRQLGDLSTAEVVKSMADALNTEIQLFRSQQVQSPNYPLEKYEPAQGMYIGAYIEQSIPGVTANKYNDFNQVTGKKHAIYFDYLNYGYDFPKQIAKQIKEAGGALHIAFEPNGGLHQVQDNAYLRQFARDANDAGIPIFLRFAYEMNGDWVAWHGNPELYREKFRLVATVMKQEAPNVAMVWVPNSVPKTNIAPYYPGDDVVDWVGINLYSVPFFNGNRHQPAEHVNPLDLLDEFYDHYAKRKPMMIGEFAASHYTNVTNHEVTKFGVTKMRMLYHGMQMKYPRIKAVHWFNVNTITAPYVNVGRRFNNYNILENKQMLHAYKEIVSDSYFLSDVEDSSLRSRGKERPASTLQLNDSTLFGSVSGLSYVTTYDPYVSKVVYHLNGNKLSESTQFPFRFNLNYDNLKAGTNQLVATVYDSKGRKAGERAISFKKGRQMNVTHENSIHLFVNESIAFNREGAFQLSAPTYIKGVRLMVPLRFISETLGATVGWDDAKKQISIQNDNKQIYLNIGAKQVYVNDTKHVIDEAPEIYNNTTFVPIRFIAEQFGANVNYDTDTKEIEIRF